MKEKAETGTPTGTIFARTKRQIEQLTATQLMAAEFYIRDRLREQFDITDATLNNGIFHPHSTRSVWLFRFVTEEKTPDRVQYTDHLDGDVLLIQGQTEGRTNHFLIDHGVREQGAD